MLLSKDIIETRLHQWRLFFESEQAHAVGFGTVLAHNDPRLVHDDADPKTCDVDAVTEAAAHAGIKYDDQALIELAELVDMMAINYLMREDEELHAAMMFDDPSDDPGYVQPRRIQMSAQDRAELMAELDSVLGDY